MASLQETFSTHPHFSVVRQVYRRLRQAHYDVFLAGGCVRDGILGVTPKDFDLATSATPDQIIALFAKTLDVGKAFGVIIVIEEGIPIEVTTFRTDGAYTDARRPSSVAFSSPPEDAKRRDFTVNALFYDLDTESISDFVGGMKDIESKIIRAVGEPQLRFQEDHLRMLRAVRFVGQLGFVIEEKTREAIKNLSAQVASVSRERIHAELEKLLISFHRVEAFREFVHLGLAQVIFPEAVWQDTSTWLAVPTGSEPSIEAWIVFWNTYLDGVPEKQEFHLRAAIECLRFSNVQKSAMFGTLEWRLCPEQFVQKSMGEIVEILFEPAQTFALSLYAQKNIIDAQKWMKAQSIKASLGATKPEALLKAKDLSDLIPPGPKLGLALRLSYWTQLEGKITSLAEAKKIALEVLK